MTWVYLRTEEWSVDAEFQTCWALQFWCFTTSWSLARSCHCQQYLFKSQLLYVLDDLGTRLPSLGKDCVGGRGRICYTFHLMLCFLLKIDWCLTAERHHAEFLWGSAVDLGRGAQRARPPPLWNLVPNLGLKKCLSGREVAFFSSYNWGVKIC